MENKDRKPWVVFSLQQCHILTQFSLRNTLKVLKRVEVEVAGCSLFSWAIDPLGLFQTLMCHEALQGVNCLPGLKAPFFTEQVSTLPLLGSIVYTCIKKRD